MRSLHVSERWLFQRRTCWNNARSQINVIPVTLPFALVKVIIYKPFATLSTPPISREKEKKVSRTASRVSSSRIGRAGWTMYKFEAPFRRHETRRGVGWGRKEEGENIDFESIDKRGRSTPSRPVSTPNWTEAGNKYYVSFVGREADFIIAAQAEADVQSVWHTLRPSTDLYSVSLYVRLSCNRVGTENRRRSAPQKRLERLAPIRNSRETFRPNRLYLE